ncbi:MAG: ABC transporter substrate-binding protein [Alphaproteobacteria bacterium]|nr:ABC transporter substrate-binding protein [Alphaproteobacteria bacterium]
MRAHWLAVAAVFAAAPATAQELKIGLGAMARSVDPHFYNSGPDVANMLHVFDKLVLQDEKQGLVAGLATSWKAVDATTWEVKLREGVTFHDGSPFTADDVAFTVKRAVDVPRSGSPFSLYVNTIKEVVVKGPHLVHLTTAEPAPLLPWDISTFGIISKKHGAAAATEDYNSGKAAIGTGPYKLVSYSPNERIVLQRNDAYWGLKEPWTKVTFSLIANQASRTAALLAGDVDAIDTVATQDIARLKSTAGVGLWPSLSNRVIYLIQDSHRDVAEHIRDADGKPMTVNPLKDPRVRQALSLSIAREALVERIMEGEGVPTGQLVPPGLFGHDPSLETPAQNFDAAKKLLADAGYPKGFQLTLHGSNGRYLNDAKITQAIGQMFVRAGVATTVETLPRAIFGTRGNEFGFSVGLFGWGTDTGEAASPLKALIRTRDAAGAGASNRGRYSNPRIDAVIVDALRTIDDKKREALLQQATRMAMEDGAIIPLDFQVNTWATRGAIVWAPRTDEFTLAMSARPK